MTVHLNDLISREEAIRLIMDKAMKENERKYEHLNDRAYYRYLHGEYCYRNAARLIEKMPAAAGSVKHGHYIKGDNGEWYCSECRRIDDKYSVAKYCWNCGAKMDEEE